MGLNCGRSTPQTTEGSGIDRTILPPRGTAFHGKIGHTYKDSTPDWKPSLPVNPPDGAPNVLLIVLDDVGYSQLSSYGSPINTPNLDALAKRGLRYTNFHTTALCSPSRGALLTGRNHHSIGLAAITEAATGYPGSFGTIPKSAATVAEVLKQNGYNTFALGKWHLTPYTTYTAAGPFDRWPLGMGFERYYGFLGGETDQWSPLLVEGNKMIDTPGGSWLPLDGRSGRSHDRLHSGPAANQHRTALLYLTRSRSDPRAASRAQGSY